MAQSVSLAWDSNPNANVAGYKVYRGTQSGVYDTLYWPGNTSSIELTDLEPGAAYFFAISAYTQMGVESDVSSEVVVNGIGAIPPADNSPPIAFSNTYSVAEDGTIGVPLTASDLDNNLLTYFITLMPAKGSLSGVPPNLSYKPQANFNGSDSFQFSVSDGIAVSAPATITLNVTPANDPPVASAATVTLPLNVATAITLVASDIDGDPLTYSFPILPTKGVITGIPPLILYTPLLNASGTDSFQFRVTDGVAAAAATVSLSFQSSNAAPVPTAASVTVPEDTTTNLVLKATDSNGDPLTFAISQVPANGTLTGTPPNVAYRAKANYSGADSFRFTVSDGKVTSAAATISLNVTAVNDRPTANAASITLSEDTPAAITLSGVDVEGTALTYAITKQPTKGLLSGTAPTLTYTPTSNLNGTDSFEFTVSDGALTSTAAAVTLTITAVNDRPIATPATLSLTENTAATLVLKGTDVEGSPLTYAIATQPSKGKLTGTAPNLTYTPSTNFNGTDSFTFTVSDGLLTSTAASVTFNIAPANTPPTASSLSLTGDEDTALPALLSGFDSDGDALTFKIVQTPTNGTLTGTAPNLSYRPATNFSGADTFRFAATDGKATSAVATASITINPVNDAPVANNSTVTMDEDKSATLAMSGSDVEGSPLAYIIVRYPANGTISGTAPNLTLRTKPNFFGTDLFQYKVTDGSATSAVASINITVNPVNDRPVATSFTKTLDEDVPIGIALVGTDVEGSPLTYAITAAPTNGTLSGTLPNLTYTPAPDFSGSDSFQYTVTDDLLVSTPATVGLTVNAINDTPEAVSAYLSVNENSPLPIVLLGTDAEDDALTYQITQSPTNGTLSGVAPNLTYQPRSGFSGIDTLRFTVGDGTSTSAVATISITMFSVNDPPVASPAALSVAEDTTLPITLVGSDPEGASLTFVVAQPPTKGTLSGTAPNISYRPLTNVSGSDSFGFYISDGALTSSVAVVSISISPVNDRPLASAASRILNEDTTLAIVLAGSDVEGSPLAYVVSTPPAFGTLSGTPPNLTYTPAANFNGTDDFEFTVSDGQLTSSPATVSLTIKPINDPPTATATSRSVAENSTVAIDLVGNDIDGDALSFLVIQSTTNGVVSGTPPSLVYQPNTNFVGSDSLRFAVTDGSLTSSVATVSITVSEVNQAPTAVARSVSLAEDGSLAITLTATDPDGDSLTFAISQGPTRGTLSGTAPSLTYRPNTNVSGSDSFKFTASDGRLTSAAATVSITISAVNDRPVATAASKSVNEDASVAITLAGSDVEGSPLSYAIATPPANGALSGTPPNVTYTPSPNFSGLDSFSFTVSDGALVSTPATISITVNPINDPPLATSTSRSVTEDSTGSIVLDGTDIDGDALTFLITQSPTNGTFSGTPPNLTYRPNTNFVGSDAIRFTVADGQSTSSVATVSITVTGINDPPTATALSASLAEDGSASIVLKGTDPDGDGLNFAITKSPTNGTLSGTAPNLTYRPNTNFFGADSFLFRVNDGSLTSAVATVSITVSAVNDRPVAGPASETVDEDSTIALVLSGSDVEGSALTYAIAVPPTNGTLVGTPPNVTYTPSTNFNGLDSFSFTVSDGALLSTPAVISLAVSPVNDPPVATNFILSLDEDTTANLEFGGTDPESDPLTVLIVQAPTNGVLVGTSPSFIYQPATNFFGADTVLFAVTDGQATSAVATVSITVNSINDAVPVALDSSVSLNEDKSASIKLSGSSADNATLTYFIVRFPANGTISGTAPNLTLRPRPNFFGSDSLLYRVTDGVRTSTVATVDITVLAVNDRPVAIPITRTLDEDSPAVITLSGTDVEGSPLTYVISTPPTNGILSGTAPDLVYTPTSQFSGTDSFQYTVSDGALTSLAATVDLTVTPVNDPPTAASASLSTTQGTPLALTLVGSDLEATPLVFQIVQSPTNGSLSGVAPSLTYTPNPGFAGSDALLFRVSDGFATSAVATISLTVQPTTPQITTAPDALVVAQSGYTEVLLTGAYSLLDNDPNLPATTKVVMVQGATYGKSFLRSTGTFAYRHYGGPEDSDSFSYVVISGSLTSQVTTVTVSILSVDQLRVTPSRSEIDFSVASGLNYIVEASSGAAWEPLVNFTAANSGVATFSDPTAGASIDKSYRVRCVGAHGSIQSDTWGFRRMTLANGTTHEAARFVGETKRRAKIIEVGVDWVRLEGPAWTANQLATTQIFASHLAKVSQAANPAANGQSFQVVDNDASRIVLSNNGQDLTSLLQVGDTIEIYRLPSVVNLFGNQIPPADLLMPSDLWTVTTPSDGSWWNLIEIGIGDPRPPGYYADIGVLEFGPLLPAEIRFLPGQTISVILGDLVEIPAVAAGRLAP
ncbi:MAG: tandem-95 repeat protein [Verrucomicrobiales bacterium]|nr:tandem-95 repeat protein [Verrucomicrobiales bacterium]